MPLDERRPSPHGHARRPARPLRASYRSRLRPRKRCRASWAARPRRWSAGQSFRPSARFCQPVGGSGHPCSGHSLTAARRTPSGAATRQLEARLGEQARVLVGRYALRRELGRGAMGVVWLARDELLDRDVAVKQLLLPAGLSEAAAEQAVARAMREARLAARLHHPNAISVFDVVTEQGRPWLVMEHLPSRSLAE